MSLIDWLARKGRSDIIFTSPLCKRNCPVVWMSRVCDPHQISCPKAKYTERVLNDLSPKAVNQSGNPFSQRGLRINCGSWRISVLEWWFDIYSRITSSIRRHRRVQVAKITSSKKGGDRGETATHQSPNQKD